MNKPECNEIPVSNINTDQDLKGWLERQAKQYKLEYLLAHADDGVIWGKFDQEKSYSLATSYDAFNQSNTVKNNIKFNPVSLRLLTLQQCRLFGADAEVMLWFIGGDRQNNKTWKARYIRDENLTPENFIPEDQILWGTQQEGEPQKGFTLVADGSQGLKHAVPLTNIAFSKDLKILHRPLRLQVRHYIDYDEDGVARIYLSRLVDLRSQAL